MMREERARPSDEAKPAAPAAAAAVESAA